MQFKNPKCSGNSFKWYNEFAIITNNISGMIIYWMAKHNFDTLTGPKMEFTWKTVKAFINTC